MNAALEVVILLTPQRSSSSIQFGIGLTDASFADVTDPDGKCLGPSGTRS
jgi:hypothetical protein